MFRASLIVVGEHSLLPELCEIFGNDTVMRFVELFGGKTITIPDKELIDKVLAMVDIYTRIEKSSTNASVVATKYGMDIDTVYAIHETLKTKLGAM